MAYETRRVVTGHTPDGKSTVLYDSQLPMLEKDAGVGARQEDRSGTAERVLWVTHGFPVDNDDPSDTASLKVDTSEGDGTIFRIVAYSPGVAPRHHRTNSIDYAVVLSGSIELQLDTGTVPLNPGVRKELPAVAEPDDLGGRLPLLADGDLSAAQKQLYQRMRTHQVPWSDRHHTLYGKAESAFGRPGLVDITLLIGRYLTISALLNGFEIPRP